MPASWEFTIYEDTPEEEAQNLMEHSALTLDLSSDDETTKKSSFRGKENTPPEGYSAQAASRAASATTLRESSASIEPTTAPRRQLKTDFVRTKVAEMDDGERSPLSALEVDEFIPEGISKDDQVIVDALPEKAKVESENVYSVPPPTFSFTKFHQPQKSSAAKTDVETDSDVVVFEDGHDGGIDGAVVDADVVATGDLERENAVAAST